MSIVNVVNSDDFLKTYSNCAGSSSKIGVWDSKKGQKQESVVDQFKRKHPEDASHVEQQVRAGKAVRIRYGAPDSSTADMSMEEYKSYFYAMLDTIPYDATRLNDVTTISISEAGWEQMKQDPDYEAWILGYFVEDRAVRNPFFGWGGNDGMVIMEHFGASIEEHHGEGFSKSVSGGHSEHVKDEESWWTKRHKRMKKHLKEQAAKAQKERENRKEIAQQEYLKQQYAGQQRLHNFLTSDGQERQQPVYTNTSVKMPFTVYDSLLDLFGGGLDQ